jgi:hypothetical protein
MWISHYCQNSIPSLCVKNPSTKSLNLPPLSASKGMKSDDQLHEMAQSLAAELGLKTDLGTTYLTEALRLAVMFDKKQQDYGSQNIARFGEKGVLVRANDKIERLRNLVWVKGDATPNNESIADSWDDLAVYGVIGRMCRDGSWK